VGQSHLTRRRARRFLQGVGLLAVAILLFALLPAGGEEFIKKSFITPGDPKPIHLNADNICTWTEGPLRIFLLHGTAWIEQGLIKISMPDSVIWVDEGRKKSSGIYYVTVYGEGGVALRDRADQWAAARVLLDLATRGEVRIKARTNKVLQQAFPNDPLYVRARAEKQIAQQSSMSAPSSPAPSAPSGGVVPASATMPGKSGTDPWVMPAVADSRQSAIGDPPPLPGAGWSAPGASAVSGTVAPVPRALPVPASTTVNRPSADPAQFGAGPGPPPAPTPGSDPAPTPLPMPPATAPVPGINPAPPLVQGPSTPLPLPGTQPGLIAPPGSSPGAAPGLAQGPKMPVPVKPDPAPLRQLRLKPRSSQPFQITSQSLSDGETAWIVTGGVILNVANPNDKMGIIDMEADRLVVWVKGKATGIMDNMKGEGETKHSRETEFYLSGHVEIRNKSRQDNKVLRADEVYYDVARNVAIALRANLEVQQPRLPYPLNIQADQIIQLNPKLFETGRTEVFATSLPSDPGLKITVTSATLEDTDTPRRNIFGWVIKDQKTGEPLTQTEKIFRGRNMVLSIEGVPVFYLPYIQTDPEDPLGPLDNIAFNYNRIFGFQFFSTWNVYDLLALRPVPGTRWQLDVDYLSLRGPALGSNYTYAGKDMFFGIPGRYEGMVKAYGIDDTHKDILGGVRGVVQFVSPPGELGTANIQALPIHHPELRGRFTDIINVQDIPDGFFFQGQIQALSDKNFLEQYYNWEYNNNPIQQTFAYLGQRQGNWAWTAYGQIRDRDWVTETNQLPRLDGFLIGQKFFDLLTYNGHASAGYYQFLPTHVPPPAYFPTDVNRVNPVRLDLWQDVSVPFALGAFKVAPYAVFDPTYYSDDVNKNDVLRLYEAAGVRVSMPLSRLYPNVTSDFFNLSGLYHKIVLSSNFYWAQSNTTLNQLPQLDRLNDDATDQALRNLAGGIQFQINPANSFNLVNNPLFNPQFYALRRLLDNTPDTLQDMEILQLDARQRLQTKRGFPGNEHVVDWMTLDLGMSIFPRPDRDNFGATVGVMNYDWVWNIGDSTSLVSSGWMDPISGGPRVFTIGGNIMRPDRTNLYLGYRQIDPLNSKAILANITYALNAKYALVGSTIYDFGVHTQVNTISLTRIGTDMQVSLGFSYNSILNTIGVNFAIVPNLFAASFRPGTLGGALPGTPGVSGIGGMGGGMGSATSGR
jgi:hypothetical protein